MPSFSPSTPLTVLVAVVVMSSASELDLDVDVSREVESHQRVDGLRRRVDDVNEALVGAHLEVLAAVLVLVGRADDHEDVLLRGQRHGADHRRASTGHRVDNLARRVVDDLVVIRLQADADLLSRHLRYVSLSPNSLHMAASFRSPTPAVGCVAPASRPDDRRSHAGRTDHRYPAEPGLALPWSVAPARWDPACRFEWCHRGGGADMGQQRASSNRSSVPEPPATYQIGPGPLGIPAPMARRATGPKGMPWLTARGRSGSLPRRARPPHAAAGPGPPAPRASGPACPRPGCRAAAAAATPRRRYPPAARGPARARRPPRPRTAARGWSATATAGRRSRPRGTRRSCCRSRSWPRRTRSPPRRGARRGWRWPRRRSSTGTWAAGRWGWRSRAWPRGPRRWPASPATWRSSRPSLPRPPRR